MADTSAPSGVGTRLVPGWRLKWALVLTATSLHPSACKQRGSSALWVARPLRAKHAARPRLTRAHLDALDTSAASPDRVHDNVTSACC